jgi:hypothetical protein
MNDLKKLKVELIKNSVIKSSRLGESSVYCANAKKYLEVCLNLLSNDQFYLINKKKYFKSLKS